ncbi:MAG: leucine-rich repeat domain-containing protein [Bacteroidetes bacterium]|nr:leucine-rich repeat domain-containing protein [Bacteroidota bacterium]MBU1717508.1 leucine-rich repeat domain-containing protein [Bacteroidota bacterium]
MKSTLLFLLCTLTPALLFAQESAEFDINQLMQPGKYGVAISKHFGVTEIPAFKANPNDTNCIALENGLRQHTFINAAAYHESKADRPIKRVEVIFSRYPIRDGKYNMYYPLLCNRLLELFRLDPSLNSKEIQWEIILQTNCHNDEDTRTLFHGIICYYEPKERVAGNEISLVESIAELEEGLPESVVIPPSATFEMKTEIIVKHYESKRQNLVPPPAKEEISESYIEKNEVRARRFARRYWSTDSTVQAVLNRNKEWKNVLVVADWTGSMYGYGAQILEWHIENFRTSGLKFFTLFNDGDHQKDSQKKVGHTGGIYCEYADNLSELIDLYDLVQLKGGGGDCEENDVEALLEGIEKYPNSDNIILIADNYSPVRDKELFDLIDKPVKVIICGYNSSYGVLEDYVQLAEKTGGSIHTIEYDIFDMKDGLAMKGLKVTSAFNALGSSKTFRFEKEETYDNLRKSYFDTTIITDLNYAIREKDNVRLLALRDQGQKKLPTGIYKIKNLKSLDFTGNSLKKVPGSLDRFVNLRVLKMDSNQIKKVSPDITGIRFLLELSLAHNQINELPREIWTYRYFIRLNISDNKLTELPRNMRFQHLKRLDVSANEIKDLPPNLSGISKLDTLIISYNKLEQIPSSISSLKKLVYLDVSNNKITTIDKRIARLRTLKTLVISGNPISAEELEKLHGYLPETEIVNEVEQ